MSIRPIARVSSTIRLHPSRLSLSDPHVPIACAEEVAGGRRRPLDRGAGVLIWSPESGLVVIDLQPLPRPRPVDIEAGRGGDRRWPVPDDRVHGGEIVEHREI